MISRRHIRVKVMQTLYSLSALQATESASALEEKAKILLQEKLKRTLDLFTSIILYLSDVAQYAERDAANKASKYLPTEEDLHINTKLAGNTALWEIKGNSSFAARVKEYKLDQNVHDDWVKKIYNNLTNSKAYAAYIAGGERDTESEKKMMQHIWEIEMLGNESIVEHFNDDLPGWEDDAELITMLMQNFFRNNFKTNFLSLLTPEKAEYARELLLTTMEKQDYVMEIITPKLANWASERVAQIDLILLRMGVCELLFFPTIPTKVTINEYIDIGKQYSTPQSGQYINGLLDSILKDLEKAGTVRKQERYRKP